MCALTTTSISASSRLTTSTRSVPVKPWHALTFVNPPAAAGGGTLRAALVEQEHDRLDALRLQDRHQPVRRVGLVEEVESHDTRRRHDRRGALERLADESDLLVLDRLDLVGRQQRVARGLVDHVRGQELEERAGEHHAVRAARVVLSSGGREGRRRSACAAARLCPRRTRGCPRRSGRARSGS